MASSFSYGSKPHVDRIPSATRRSDQGVTSGRGLDSFTAKTTELPPLLHPIMMTAITITVVIFQPKPVTRRNWFLLIMMIAITITVVIFQPKPVTRRNWFLLIKQTNKQKPH